MSNLIDVYTPWREQLPALQARHVGRQEELEAIHAAIHAWLANNRPLPVYLFGPRGSGKSHLISLVLHELRANTPDGVRLLHVPEDVPQALRASDLLRRMDQAGSYGLRRLSGGRDLLTGPPRLGRAIVFLEAFDQHLQSMTEDERRELRRCWQGDEFLLIATGSTLPDALTSRETAFYAAFQAWPIRGLEPTDAAELLNGVVGAALVGSPSWPARRDALLTLAGGSPRSLLALGMACARDPSQWASDSLLDVIQQFTAHYQLRFRDLSPQQQQVLEVLTSAPGEMTPSDIAAELGVSTTQASGQCRRMTDAGVLEAREDGRNSRYRITDPIFRYWLEYRNTPWEESRIGILARLLEAVLQPSQIADLIIVDSPHPRSEAPDDPWTKLLDHMVAPDDVPLDQLRRWSRATLHPELAALARRLAL